MFVVNEDGKFILNGLYGSNVIMMPSEQKTFIIAPEQYQQLLMGVNQSLHYEMIGPNHNPEDAVDFNYKLNDLTRFDFNASIIDLDDFLFRYEVKDLKGMIYGWHLEEYKTIEGFCETSVLDRWPEAMQFLQDKQDCNVANSFLQSLEKMENLTYPFEKTYQDPLKVCYSPKRDTNGSIKMEQITLDLRKMFFQEDENNNLMNDENIFRFGSTLPFMSIYVHQRGQFIGRIGKSVMNFNSEDVTGHCESTEDEENCRGTKMEIDITQVTVLNSRHDSKISCNESLENEDLKTLEYVMQEKIGCSPMYWIGFAASKGIGGCTKLNDYGILNNITTAFTNYNGIQEAFEPPCETMYVATNVKTQKGRSVQNKVFDYRYDEPKVKYGKRELVPNITKTGLYLDMTINMAADNFQNIVNQRGFTVENCWAGIGGFVGIFVGMSLMQVPELIIDFIGYFKQISLFK